MYMVILSKKGIAEILLKMVLNTITLTFKLAGQIWFKKNDDIY